MSPPRQSACLSNIGEFKLIQSLPRRFSTQGFQPTIATGDDAAVFAPSPSQQVVISTDLLIEDIHFSRKTSTFYDIGYKAASSNLSDIAAMGAAPMAIFVSIALPDSLTFENWQEFYRGLAQPCREHKVQLLGGDTSSSPTGLFVAITITGQVHPEHVLSRQGAKNGHLIYVSGTLGDSAAGLAYLKTCKRPPQSSKLSKSINYIVQRHLHPTARIALGQLLAIQPYASSAMDLSDGLSGDLNHLCRHSKVGALIYSERIPISQHMNKYATRIGADPFHWALHGGEDYELLFTIPPQWRYELETISKKRRTPITQIGLIQPKRFGIRIEQSNGKQDKLIPSSYDHFFK